MEFDESYDDILDDEKLAPLKRNHACLQCKKRKVKCDAIRPTCSPCLRSHAHALRSAQRSKTKAQPLVCTFTENDSLEASESPPAEVVSNGPRRTSGSGDSRNGGLGAGDGGGERKKGAGVAKKSVVGVEREKEVRREEEKETLLARIAELESRLSSLTPEDSGSALSQRNEVNGFSTGNGFSTDNGFSNDLNFDTGQAMPQFSMNGGQASMSNLPSVEETAGMDQNWEFSNLFMVPAHWPRNLPSPFLLDHLIDTFFSHTPQLPRMIHRPTFLARLRLPPTSRNFPHPSLLHAICASASAFTAWVNSLPPEALDAAVSRQKSMGMGLESLEDFGVAQAEAGDRAIRESSQSNLFGPGQTLFDITQATIILSDHFYTKGMPLRAYMMAGQTSRLMSAMEMHNKNVPKRFKEPLFPEPRDAVGREERLATVWMAFTSDAGFSMNSCWSSSMPLRDVMCNLPTSAAEWRKKNEIMLGNPQNAISPDLYVNHPLPDPFVLVVKASILVSRAASWLRDWQQRDIIPGDEMKGVSTPGFCQILNDVYAFQSSMPSALRNIFRMDNNTTNSPFDPHILVVNILPNVAICVLYEHFVDWREPALANLSNLERAYQSVVGLLHLIPSNLDISLVMTSVLTFSLYTVGRIIASFVQRALSMQQLGLAVRYRADLSTIQNILDRYGQKFAMGQMMSTFLEHYLKVDNASTLSCEDFNLRDQAGKAKTITYPEAGVIETNTAFDWPLPDLAYIEDPSGSGGVSSGSSKTTPESLGPGPGPGQERVVDPLVFGFGLSQDAAAQFEAEKARKDGGDGGLDVNQFFQEWEDGAVMRERNGWS